MFDRLIRYLPALDYIRKNKPRKILEVGSGAKGLGEFYDQKFVGCDLKLDGNPVHNMTFVQCSASDLPFSDREFDLVICMDMMEHIPKKERRKVLEEMMRVTSHVVIIGYPCGQEAITLSKKMLKWFRKRRSGTARWMEEHVKNGLPDESNMFNWTNRTYTIYWNENLHVCEWLLKLEENGHFLKLEKFLFAHFRPHVEFILRRLSFGICYRKIWILRNFT